MGFASLIVAGTATAAGALVAGHICLSLVGTRAPGGSGATGGGSSGSGSTFARVLTVVGAGVAVGTALGVVVPEGMSLVNTGEGEGQGGVSLVVGFVAMAVVNWAASTIQKSNRGNTLNTSESIPLKVITTTDHNPSSATLSAIHPRGDAFDAGTPGDQMVSPSVTQATRKSSLSKSSSAVAPLSVILDGNPSGNDGNSMRRAVSAYNIDVEGADPSEKHSFPGGESLHGHNHNPTQNSSPNGEVVVSVVLSLVVHSIADGIALGATAAASPSSGHDHHIHGDASLAMYVAMAVHKVPAAIALATYLASAHVPRPYAWKCLLSFALATPLGALATFGLVSLFSNGSDIGGGTLVVISGGSFLHAATVHMVPEALGETPTLADMASFVVGCLLPPILFAFI